MVKTQEQQFISNHLIAKGIKKSTIEFFLSMLENFDISDPITSTSKKLAVLHGVSDRTIRRYVQSLSKDHKYIRVKPLWNNDNPLKPYIEINMYYKTNKTEELIQKSKQYGTHDTTVNFRPGYYS